MQTIRLTMAQAIVRYLANQFTDIDGKEVPFFGGVWAIFGHGNVAGLGEALYGARETLPTFRAHNEQAMAHAAIAFAKTHGRRRAMACTSSIGPGATNMVTAAATAHVNRLPLLLLPGDVFANRRPDPVLQQIEDFADGTVSANDCFKPVSRYFDRLTRPEQILSALPRAMSTLTDPAGCGPVTLAICQDVQTEAYDYPESFFARACRTISRRQPQADAVQRLADGLRSAKKPLLIAGGGVHYSGAAAALAELAAKTGIPVAETQAGKSALPFDHAQCLGGIGVTGTAAANAAAEQADLVVGIGTRLQDFTTGSRSLFANPDRRLVQVNVNAFDTHKHGADAVPGDALEVVRALSGSAPSIEADPEWTRFCADRKTAWEVEADAALAPQRSEAASDAQVIGAVNRACGDDAIVVCAAGGLPGELHRLWRSRLPGSYHLEYGYSCMGYEIAGGVGVKLAAPDRHVVVMVGDGSYLMMNSEIATAVMLGLSLTIVVLDNRGFGCIDRLQRSTGSPGFNNLLRDTVHERLPDIDFAAHAASLGASAVKIDDLASLEEAVRGSRTSEGVSVFVIDTEPAVSTEAGGHWWDVAVAEVSELDAVSAARDAYRRDRQKQRVDG